MTHPFSNARIAPPELLTVRDWLRFAMSRFGHAGLAHGQGFLDPFDEAVYLICHTLALPSERLELFLGAALTADERAAWLGSSSSAPTNACPRPTSLVRLGSATSPSASTAVC